MGRGGIAVAMVDGAGPASISVLVTTDGIAAAIGAETGIATIGGGAVTGTGAGTNCEAGRN